MNLIDDTYRVTLNFTDRERFNLVSQLERCSVSIPSNIAEGTSKSTDKHFNKYSEDSLGSAFEWETQLIIAFSQGYMTEEKFTVLENKIQQLKK